MARPSSKWYNRFMKRSYLVPGIVGLIIGVFLGYSLSYVAPDLGARLAGGAKRGSFAGPAAAPPSNNSNPVAVPNAVEQCKQNCEGIGQSKCTPTVLDGTESTTSHAYCEPHKTFTGTYWTCDLSARVEGCKGGRIGEIYAFPPIGYEIGKNGLAYQNCATVQCNLAVQRGYWSEAFRR